MSDALRVDAGRGFSPREYLDLPASWYAAITAIRAAWDEGVADARHQEEAATAMRRAARID